MAQEPLNSNPANQSDPIYLQSSTFDPLQDSTTNAAAATLDQQLAAPAPENYYAEKLLPCAIQRCNSACLDSTGRGIGWQGAGLYSRKHPCCAHEPRHARQSAQPSAVRWVGDYRPNYKLPLSLSQTLNAATSGQNSATAAAAPLAIDVYVVAFIGESLNDLQSAVVAQGGTIAEASDSPVGLVVRATIPASGLLQLAQYSAVNWIEPYQTMELFNAQGRKVMNAEYVWQDLATMGRGRSSPSPIWAERAGEPFPDFTARDQSLCPQRDEPGFTKLPIQDDLYHLNGHGTHVAGSVAKVPVQRLAATLATINTQRRTHGDSARSATCLYGAQHRWQHRHSMYRPEWRLSGARLSEWRAHLQQQLGASDAGGYNTISSIVATTSGSIKIISCSMRLAMQSWLADHRAPGTAKTS